MIRLKSLINENSSKYGCLMAMLNTNDADKLNKFGRKLIPENILYISESGYGYEEEKHCTIKYGLTERYTEENIGRIISRISPFNIKIKGISIFENDKFDVVKLDVEGKELIFLNLQMKLKRKYLVLTKEKLISKIFL